jgi:hypothetical protein
MQPIFVALSMSHVQLMWSAHYLLELEFGNWWLGGVLQSLWCPLFAWYPGDTELILMWYTCCTRMILGWNGEMRWRLPPNSYHNTRWKIMATLLSKVPRPCQYTVRASMCLLFSSTKRDFREQTASKPRQVTSLAPLLISTILGILEEKSLSSGWKADSMEMVFTM